MSSNLVSSYRKLIMPRDLNGQNTLFGGSLASFIDEAAAMYVMCQLDSADVVTIEMSKLVFKVPVRLGDFLEFETSTSKIGNSSITVHVDVFKKSLGTDKGRIHVNSAELTFVQIDPITSKAVPHILSKNKEGGYNLFIDDQINDINSDTGLPIRNCRVIDPKRKYSQVDSYESAIKLMNNLGCPLFVSFDHDLGETEDNMPTKSGYDVAKWIVEQDMNANGEWIPKGFDFRVHSANPIGKKNIESYLNNYLKSKGK